RGDAVERRAALPARELFDLLVAARRRRHPLAALRRRPAGAIAVVRLEPGQPGPGGLVARVDRQHVFERNLLVRRVVHRTAEPQPRLLVLLVALDHLQQQPLPVGAPARSYRERAFVEPACDLVAHGSVLLDLARYSYQVMTIVAQASRWCIPAR